MLIERRGFLTGVLATIAAPAIVRIDNIMPVRAVVWSPNYSFLSMITREAVELFVNTNRLLIDIERQYSVGIGSQLQVRLSN